MYFTNKELYLVKDGQIILTDSCWIGSADTNRLFEQYKKISENIEEQKIDEGEKVTINRGDKTFIVHHNNIYCYGEVDFRKGSEDCEEIANFSFLNFLGSKGVVIPSDYDYERHECHSPIRYYRWSETWRPDVLARYAHACLNKPKRIVLFKRVI